MGTPSSASGTKSVVLSTRWCRVQYCPSGLTVHSSCWSGACGPCSISIGCMSSCSSSSSLSTSARRRLFDFGRSMNCVTPLPRMFCKASFARSSGVPASISDGLGSAGFTCSGAARSRTVPWAIQYTSACGPWELASLITIIAGPFHLSLVAEPAGASRQ